MQQIPSKQALGGPPAESRGPAHGHFSQWGRGGSCRFFIPNNTAWADPRGTVLFKTPLAKISITHQGSVD